MKGEVAEMVECVVKDEVIDKVAGMVECVVRDEAIDKIPGNIDKQANPHKSVKKSGEIHWNVMWN